MNPPLVEDDRTAIKQDAAPGPAATPSAATVSGPSYDSQSPAYAHRLPRGTRLGEFELHDLVGEGGFGIVYLAWDNSLERKVAVKEYMPSSIAARAGDNQVGARSERHRATFDAGLRSFIREAKLLAMFDHPSLLKVYRFWEANGTAYMAMPFYEGVTLKDSIAALPEPPDEAWLLALLAPLTEALGVIHAEHCYHRDIAPDNIMLLAGSDRPLLLDFGAARRAIGDLTQSLTVILKPGFAPVEQYGEVPGLRQGPWTDVYGLAAVVYWVITGEKPPQSVGRMVHDSMAPLADRASARYSARFLQAIDNALAVLPERRTQTIDALRQELGLSPLRVAAPPPPTMAPGSPAQPRGDASEMPARQAELAPLRDSKHNSNALRRWAAVAGLAATVIAAGLWWASQGPPAEPAPAASGAGNAGTPALSASMVSPGPPEPRAAEAVPPTEAAPIPAARPDRQPARAVPTADAVKRARRPPAVNSAECAAILQSISLGDSNPRLAERLNELGCR